jgi:Flp pilus assembly protein TadG
MVELALCLPVIALLLFGVIQFGIVFNNYVTLTDAVRAGARKATVSRDLGAIAATAAVTQAVRNSAAGLDQSTLNPSVTSSWVHGNDVTVTATYPYAISLLGVVVKSGSLSSSTTERVE